MNLILNNVLVTITIIIKLLTLFCNKSKTFYPSTQILGKFGWNSDVLSEKYAKIIN